MERPSEFWHHLEDDFLALLDAPNNAMPATVALHKRAAEFAAELRRQYAAHPACSAVYAELVEFLRGATALYEWTLLAVRAIQDDQPVNLAEAPLINRAALRLDDLITDCPPTATGKPASDVAHSADFRSVRWFGRSYSFTAGQAAAVRELWAAWELGTPELGQATLCERIGDSRRLSDVFRSNGKPNPAWGDMIREGKTKGTFMLVEPQTILKATV